MRQIYLAIVCLGLAGCSTDPVYLKHAETGQVVQCGPYPTRGPGSSIPAWHESQCIGDYQRQGYERTMAPE